MQNKFGNSGSAIVKKLMCVEICMHLDMAYIVGLLGIYLSSSIWIAAKGVFM